MIKWREKKAECIKQGLRNDFKRLIEYKGEEQKIKGKDLTKFF